MCWQWPTPRSVLSYCSHSVNRSAIRQNLQKGQQMDERITLAEILQRWVYTREGIRKLRLRDPEFPEPVVKRPRNRGNGWRLLDIESYEKRRPELLSEQEKHHKVAVACVRAIWGRGKS